MFRKGQVTIFVIIVIVLIAVISLVFLSNKSQISHLKVSKLNVEEIESFIKGCIEETGEDAVYFIS